MTTKANATTYNAQFYDEITPLSIRSAGVIAPLLIRHLQPASVIDVGCGAGAWLAAFELGGVTDIMGLEGSWVDTAQLHVDAAKIVAADLQHPPAIDRQFDLAMSLEVAEHLEPASAARFVAFLTGLAPVVMFSGAAPQQGGHGHKNEQWPAYWAALFAAEGFHALDIVRPYVWGNTDVSYWYSQNIVVYARHDRLDDVRPAFPLDADGLPLPLVHPELARRLARRINGDTLRALLRESPALGRRFARRQLGRWRARSHT